MTMKLASCLVILAAVYTGGCSSAPLVSHALDDAGLDLPIDNIRASGIWRRDEPGRGLEVNVFAIRDAGDYARNLELYGAAQVCAALATNDRILEWAYIDVYYFNQYRCPPGARKNVVGVAEVIVRREALLALGKENAPPSEYPRHWKFVSGFKDQSDSKELLSWKESPLPSSEK